ncbi:MAG TPA: DUF4252 domain-containing protein [Pyrinomonadaceae bacterium]|nr:DUF4252 domain-containing protein [Pyrinomonadaceae bacterium]
MKSFLEAIVRPALAALVVALAASSTASAQAPDGQGARLRIDSLDRLGAKAAESVSVNMDENLLRIVPPVLSDRDAEERGVKELVAKLKGVFVRRFGFDAEGQFTDADLTPIREQLRAPGWSRIVDIRSRREGKTIEVYLKTAGTRVEGLAVISYEPKELAVINIVGDVDLDKLRKLEGNFGVPELDIESRPKPANQ